jgi:hypothetical protein
VREYAVPWYEIKPEKTVPLAVGGLEPLTVP